MSLRASIGSSFSPELLACKGRTAKAKGFIFESARGFQIEALALGAIVCFLFSAASVRAATYTVKAGGGGNYTTIQSCASAMAAGDTCTVYAGTYNENVNVPSGTSGSLKTITVNSGDTVYVHGFSLGSYDVVNGFQIQNPSSPNSNNCVSIATNAVYDYITNNVMYACGGSAMISEPNNSPNTAHIIIQGNTLSYGCSTSSAPNVCTGMQINGSYELIENNDISHVSDALHFYGSHNVVRKNTFHDASSSDCGSQSGNCHIDFIESEPVTGTGQNNVTQYNLYEANTELNNLGPNGHGFLTQADACNGNCFNVIIRFNQGEHVGSAGLYDDNASDKSDPGFSHVVVYNNTFADFNKSTDSGPGDITLSVFNNSTYGASINNIFYYPTSLSDFFVYGLDTSVNATYSRGYNMAWCTGTCDFRAGLYSAGTSFTADAVGNTIANPLFTNFASNDLSLASGSPAIAGGTHLTTVASGDSGSGTSLVVNDADFFQDGSGIAGVNADCIAVTTTTNHVCVIAVNYSTKTLTLASSITRSPGDPVWLYSDSSGDQVLTGAAPNIGASFGSASNSGKTPLPPTGVTNSVVVQ